MALLRLILIGGLALIAVHWLARTYLRSLKREALERVWRAENPDDPEGEAEFIAAAMADFDRSLAVKILFLVYVFPVCVIGVTVYLVNYA